MKAYMSDGRARATATRPGPDAGFTERCAGYLATFEAQRILAVTEPAEQEGFRMLGPGHWTLFEVGPLYPNSSPVREHGEALADALRAFVVSR